MATTAGTVATNLIERVYATGGIAHTQTWVISILSKTQRVANAYLRTVRSSTALAVLAEKLVYKLRDDLPAAIDIIRITETRGGNAEQLEHVDDLLELSAYDVDWFRAITGTRYETWTQLGRDLLVIYPGKAVAGTATVHYTKLTTALAAAGTAFELPDEDVQVAKDLAEIILLARDKQIVECSNKLEQLTERIGLEVFDD
jgi:hypothetical protein